MSIWQRKKVDAVLLAGDLYDKPVPPAEAVTLWTGSSLGYPAEGFLFLPSLETMIVRNGWPLPPGSWQGGHSSDGPVSRAPASGSPPGRVWGCRHYALRHLKPALVRHWNPEADIASYEEAVSYALGAMEPVDKTRRNVLLAHQFVTGGVTCESEERSVGGVDQIPAPLFAAFDYVALGHLHGPQSVEGPPCGTAAAR